MQNYGYHGLSGRRTGVLLLCTSEPTVREKSDSFFLGKPPPDISPRVSDLNPEE